MTTTLRTVTKIQIPFQPRRWCVDNLSFVRPRPYRFRTTFFNHHARTRRRRYTGRGVPALRTGERGGISLLFLGVFFSNEPPSRRHNPGSLPTPLGRAANAAKKIIPRRRREKKRERALFTYLHR